jgi:surface antigen
MREAARCLRAGLVLGAALSAGSCSISLPIASLVKDDQITTGSVKARPASPLSAELGAEDWRRAKGALAIAVDPQGNGSRVSWDNPETGLKGTFVPTGKPFVKNDEVCRSFLATVVGQATALSLQGTACRPSGGEWTIRTVAPARRPAAG